MAEKPISEDNDGGKSTIFRSHAHETGLGNFGRMRAAERVKPVTFYSGNSFWV